MRESIPSTSSSVFIPEGWQCERIPTGLVLHKGDFTGQAGTPDAAEGAGGTLCLTTAHCEPDWSVRHIAEHHWRRYTSLDPVHLEANEQRCGGHPCIDFKWTDGIADIRSWFIQLVEGVVIQVQFSVPGDVVATTSQGEAMEIVEALATSLRPIVG